MEIGACGTVCGECQLANLFKDAELSGILSDIALESGLSQDAVREKFQCHGCHSPGNRCGNECEIRKCCVVSQKLDNCALCDSFDACKIMQDFESDGNPVHHQAIENLRAISTIA